jgi:(R,R)-butanediol dehydrogenase / meso-butanediol dehydrogenase / diacetyl reductase
MKALVYLGPETLEVQERPVPVPSAGQALVRIRAAGICGTDHSILAGKHSRARPPLVMGHECAGELVAAPGGAPDGVREGDAVTVEPLISCGTCAACRSGNAHVCQTLKLYGIDTDGAFAQYLLVSTRSLRPLGKNIDFSLGALIEPLAVAVHSVRLAGLTVGDSVCVLGGGPIGALLSIVARLAGASPILVCERQPFRVERLRSIGFDVIDTSHIDPTEEVLRRTGGEGVDVVFEAAGVAQTVLAAYRVCRVRGKVIQVANPRSPVPTDLLALSFRELAVRGARVYARGDFHRAVAIAAEVGPTLRRIQSEPFTLEQGETAFRRSREGADVMRVLFAVD